MHCWTPAVALVLRGIEGAALRLLCGPAAIIPADWDFKSWPLFEDSTRANQSLGSGICSTRLLCSRLEGLDSSSVCGGPCSECDRQIGMAIVRDDDSLGSAYWHGNCSRRLFSIGSVWLRAGSIGLLLVVCVSFVSRGASQRETAAACSGSSAESLDSRSRRRVSRV